MKNKKALIIILIIIVLLILAYIFIPGFTKNESIILLDYKVSEDNGEITLKLGNSSSMGYTRGYTNKEMSGESYYLNFYNAFGGLNGKIGAINEIVIKSNEEVSKIYFNRPNKEYKLVLERNEETGKWVIPENEN